MKILTIFLILVGLTKSINAEELKTSNSHQFNFFSGVFDINADFKKSSELLKYNGRLIIEIGDKQKNYTKNILLKSGFYINKIYNRWRIK